MTNEIIQQSEFDIVKESLIAVDDLKAKIKDLKETMDWHEANITGFKERVKDKLTQAGVQSIKKDNLTFYLIERVQRDLDQDEAIKEIESALKDKEDYLIYKPILNQTKFLQDFPDTESLKEEKTISIGMRKSKTKDEVK